VASACDREQCCIVYPVEQVFRPQTTLARQVKSETRTIPARRENSETKDKLTKDTSKYTSRDTPMTRLTVTARALKVTVPLDVAEIAGLPDPGGQARCQLAITCEGKIYTADIATKSLRKAKATIAASGAENVFAMVQGKLKGNEIVECGLVAQVKTPKPVTASAA
jgi:hypothetical protein